MSVSDAKGIFTGGDDAATQYFRRTTGGDLTKRFMPIVKQSTDKVRLAQQYNSLPGRGRNTQGSRNRRSSTPTSRKALDGLFIRIAEQWRSIRGGIRWARRRAWL